MNLRLTFLFIAFVFFYACKRNSDFFKIQECDKISLDKGVIITDHFERFQVKFPDSSWLPERNHYEFGNGVYGAIFEENSFKYISVNELSKAQPWMTQAEQQIDIESRYNVIESGTMKIQDKESLWNLVEDEDDVTAVYTLFVTVEHPKENLFYTLNISVTKDKYDRQHICELEHVIKSFKFID